MRATRRVSVWPVGLSGGLRWEGPLCERDKARCLCLNVFNIILYIILYM